jgi:protocatechuate 3,4-dioxygenase beta subunit
MIRLAAALLCATFLNAQTTVQGKVTNIVDGRPLAGVAVVLQGAEDAYLAETDREGRFRIQDVIPGRYQAKPQREGFMLRPAVRFAVEAGTTAQELELRLTPFGAISGRVVDTDGDAVSRIQVEALRYGYTNGKKQLETAGRARTNDRGEYGIFGLAPGRYYLRATDSSRFSWANGIRTIGPKPPTTYTTIWFPAALDIESGVQLELSAGTDLRDHDIRLHPQRTYTMRIRMAGSADDTARPRLSMRSPAGPSFMMDLRYGAPWIYPDAMPGTYYLEADDPKGGLSARRSVRLVDSDLEVTLTLAPPAALSGSVRVEGGAAAVAGVRLEAEDATNNAAARTRADGTFTIPNIQPVPYSVRVDAPAGTYLKSLKIGDQQLSAPLIDMAHATGPLTVTLGSDGGTLAGQVDVEDAAVVLVPAAWPDLARSTTADKDGRFELHDLAPGDYSVFAWADAEPGAPLDPGFRRQFADRAVTVHIAPRGSAMVQVKTI